MTSCHVTKCRFCVSWKYADPILSSHPGSSDSSGGLYHMSLDTSGVVTNICVTIGIVFYIMQCWESVWNIWWRTNRQHYLDLGLMNSPQTAKELTGKQPPLIKKTKQNILYKCHFPGLLTFYTANVICYSKLKISNIKSSLLNFLSEPPASWLWARAGFSLNKSLIKINRAGE